MKPLREVPLKNSKDGGPTKLYYFDFNDLIKSLLKQEAAKGLSALFSVITAARWGQPLNALFVSLFFLQTTSGTTSLMKR